MKQIIIYLSLSFIFVFHASGQCAKAHADFILVTPEKSGTHLLSKTITQLIDKEVLNCWEHTVTKKQLDDLLKQCKEENKYLHMHALPHKAFIEYLKKINYKVIFLMRDPRDQAVSLYYYINKGWAYGSLNVQLPFGRLSPNEQLDEIITGARYGLSGTESIIGKRMPWMKEKASFVCPVFFENLVGQEGGGSRLKQLKEVRRIANHLQLKMDDEELDQRSQNLFGKPGEKTFRSGQIGSWKQHFTAEHIRNFKRIFGKELIELGYEKNSRW